jgi:ATP-dependent RNA helicase RhlE
MDFSHFGLRPEIMRAIKDLGFLHPTPIQADSVPHGLAGRDLLACAATGSGKTAAFALPILQKLAAKPRGGTRALVLTPTRELCAQINDHIAELATHTPVRGAAIYGGVGMGPQEHALRSGVDIVIATPGRLIDHMRSSYTNFDRLEILVLDEADRMLDMGFLPDIKRILRRLPERRQTLFFSATMPPPIATLAKEMLKNPAFINQERRAAPPSAVRQAVYPVDGGRKAALLMTLLQNDDVRNVIVFTRTKARTNRLCDALEKSGVNAARIHGNRSQSQREKALDGFRDGKVRVLVATDVASRGIDVEDLSHVINFDVPHVPEDYIHRVGRTGRAGATGDAITFVSPEEEQDLRQIERAVGSRLPRVKLPDFDYSGPEENLKGRGAVRTAGRGGSPSRDRNVARSDDRRGPPSQGGRSGGGGRSSGGRGGSGGRGSSGPPKGPKGGYDRDGRPGAARPATRSERDIHGERQKNLGEARRSYDLRSDAPSAPRPDPYRPADPAPLARGRSPLNRRRR